MWLSFGSNLAILCVFKYLTFFLENLTRVLGLAGVAFQAPAIDLLLPVGSFMSGLSLGRRHGFCPLYPLACGAFFLPTVFLLMNYTALPHCLMAAVPALAGNLAGAARHRMKRKKGADAP